MLSSLNLQDIIIRMSEDEDLPAHKIANYLGVSVSDVDPIVAAVQAERERARKDLIDKAKSLVTGE